MCTDRVPKIDEMGLPKARIIRSDGESGFELHLQEVAGW
jgi:hypothetical protein